MAIQWGQPAALPGCRSVHLDDERPFATRRGIGKVSHAALVVRDIHIMAVGSILSCGYDRHVDATLDFRKEEMACVQPSKPLGIGKKEMRFSTENGCHHSRPSCF